MQTANGFHFKYFKKWVQLTKNELKNKTEAVGIEPGTSEINEDVEFTLQISLAELIDEIKSLLQIKVTSGLDDSEEQSTTVFATVFAIIPSINN